MITTAPSRSGDAGPAAGDGGNGHAEVKENGHPPLNGSPPAGAEPAVENGLTDPGAQQGEGEPARPEAKLPKPPKRKTKAVPASRPGTPAPNSAEHARPAVAVFCWENPDTPVGRAVARTLAALARRKTLVHLFASVPFGLDFPDLREHAVGEGEGDDLFARVQDYTSRAANAFLHEFPGGSPHVTLLGYEWSGAGPLGLLRGLKNNRTVFSLSSMERQRSDMTSELSKHIDELEQRTLREAQVILAQQPAAADTARYWVGDCASRLVAARQPFPVDDFESDLDPGEVKGRYQVGPVDPTILYVGDLSERYGADLLVKAMPAVLRNHPQARLILVGDGPLYWTLRVYSRYLLLDHAIRFPGSVVGRSMHELVAACDLVAVPSREATPWWPIQAAWAARRPVVATHPAAPGLLEHERDSVLVYPVEQSLVWGVERVLYDIDLGAGLAGKGRNKLEERFGWNCVAEQIEELMGVPARA
jgi:glycosyltransferase involved in cell wall biosynthesis